MNRGNSALAPVVFYSETLLPTDLGDFILRVYRTSEGEEPVAMLKADVTDMENVPVRVHSACFTAETLHSLKCDCREQLDFSLAYVQQHGGVVIYLPQEGRGIGLGNKIKAYALQQQGHDTISANEALHLPVDARTYSAVAGILNDLGIKSIRLMTNNPEKANALIKLGIKIGGRIPVDIPPNKHSFGYLLTKREKMGHFLTTAGEDDSIPASGDRPLVHLNFALCPSARRHRDGEISCKKDWQRVHGLREQYSAIAVGAETWRLDKPRLTARTERLGREPVTQPKRVIFAGAHHVELPGDGLPTFVVGSTLWENNGVTSILSFDYSLAKPLQQLNSFGLSSLLVEGGPRLWKSFLQQGYADKLTIYVSSISVEEALECAYNAFPQLPNTMMPTRLGKGILLSWSTEDSNEVASQLISYA